MFIYKIFNEQLRKIEDKLITKDDRNFQVKCINFLHEFAPCSIECACGKYLDIKKLIK